MSGSPVAVMRPFSHTVTDLHATGGAVPGLGASFVLFDRPYMSADGQRWIFSADTDLATTERLAPMTPPDALLVTESGIFTPLDVTRLERCGARAMLVGESLMRQPDVAAATRALLG